MTGPPVRKQDTPAIAWDPRKFLASLGFPPGDLHSLPSSEKRFPDGAHYRVEIPSTEGPRSLEAVLEEAEILTVPVHRVSQGTGVTLQTADEMHRMASLGASAGIEVSLFVRPGAEWASSVMARSPAGRVIAASSYGQEQVAYGLTEIRLAAERGFRSVLIGDVGLLGLFDAMRKAEEVPFDMQAKTSVMLPVGNPATARFLQELGADSINLPVDLTLAQIAAIRASIDIPIDMYIESPEDLGGLVRVHEVAEMVRVAAPIYLKFGLRDAPDIYPAGTHLEELVVSMSRERVRRARLALDLLERAEIGAETSHPGASGLAVPVPLHEWASGQIEKE